MIEHLDHGETWVHLPTEALERSLWMYRERLRDLYRDAKICPVLVWPRIRTPAEQISHLFTRIPVASILLDDPRQELATARTHFAYKEDAWRTLPLTPTDTWMPPQMARSGKVSGASR